MADDYNYNQDGKLELAFDIFGDLGGQYNYNYDDYNNQ